MFFGAELLAVCSGEALAPLVCVVGGSARALSLVPLARVPRCVTLREQFLSFLAGEEALRTCATRHSLSVPLQRPCGFRCLGGGARI
jgi:hypothetical protein